MQLSPKYEHFIHMNQMKSWALNKTISNSIPQGFLTNNFLLLMIKWILVCKHVTDIKTEEYSYWIDENTTLNYLNNKIPMCGFHNKMWISHIYYLKNKLFRKITQQICFPSMASNFKFHDTLFPWIPCLCQPHCFLV